MILKNYFKTNGKVMGWSLLILVFFWIVMLIVLPQLYMFNLSFHPHLPPPEMGGPKDHLTLENYRYLLFAAEKSPNGRSIYDLWTVIKYLLFFGDELPAGYNFTDLAVFGRTLVAAACVTILDLLICYPIAYYLGQTKGGGFVRILVLLLIIPYWINEILRAFAFKIIFGDSGVLNEFLFFFNIIDSPIDFIRMNVALYAGLGYAYILLMIFPMYNVIESLDRNQIEAARDMGAPWWMIHKRIVIPYAKPGIASGCTMVFMLSAGALAAPQILGGPSSLWFTQLVYQWFNTGGNWPQASAYAIVLLLACLFIVLSVMKLFKVNMGDIGK